MLVHMLVTNLVIEISLSSVTEYCKSSPLSQKFDFLRLLMTLSHAVIPRQGRNFPAIPHFEMEPVIPR